VAESYQYAAGKKAGPCFGNHDFNLILNGSGIILTTGDSHISYLPMAHVFERAMVVILIGVGARMGFYQGDTLKLLDDVGMDMLCMRIRCIKLHVIAELEPTFFASVPRLFNRIYDRVWAGVKAKGPTAEALFKVAPLL
jgi:long-chain acyl-CoA synthetase